MFFLVDLFYFYIFLNIFYGVVLELCNFHIAGQIKHKNTTKEKKKKNRMQKIFHLDIQLGFYNSKISPPQLGKKNKKPETVSLCQQPPSLHH